MKFLVDETHLFVSPSLAARIGVEEALLLQQLHYRLGTNGIEKAGHIWYCQTYQDWTKQFYFWNVPKIRRLLVKLEQEHLIHSSNQFNRFYTDRSKWYRIDYEKVGELLQMKLPNQEELFPEKQSIPERKKKTNPSSNPEVTSVIRYLNTAANKQFNEQSKTNIRLVNAILSEGFTVEDCHLVIDEQVSNWKNDLQMRKYLRPITLFRSGNFESYLNNALTRQQEINFTPAPVVLDFGEGDDE